MPPVDFDPTEPLPGDRPAEAWVVKLTLNITRVVEELHPPQPGMPPQPMKVQKGAVSHEEVGEGATPGEAYRAALGRLRPTIRAYRLEGGPLPLVREES